ncbi:DUF748 domain-containing protein [Accumulibacter sp.]|uniref:DUF748 domain-containing protein n=1 Tax=Accumulibacter sp. TaxID=2053492 RepID=UPI00261894A8|nr:DUF748 domain-containing protein [Accumulibacter sp.]
MTIKKLALGTAFIVLVIGALGYFALPPLVRSMVVDGLSNQLHRPVSVEGVSINPYTLSVQVAGLAIQEKGGGQTVAGFDSLYLNLESSSLLRGGPVVSELKLVGPVLRLVRYTDGRFNFSDLIDEFLARPATDDPTPLFSVNNIQISGGRVELDDQVLDEKHLISEVNIALPFISSLPTAAEIFVEPAFSAAVDGSPLVIQGKSKPFAETLESELALDLRDVQLAKYLDYLSLRLPVQVVSGALDSDLKLSFHRQHDAPAALILSGSVTVKDVDVKDASGAALLAVKRLQVLATSLDPLGRKFVIDRVAIESPEIHARVSRQGEMNWLQFFRRELAARAGSAEEVKPVPAVWSLGAAQVSSGALHWLDESHGTPFDARIEGLELDLRNLDSQGDAPAQFDVAWRLDAGEWIKHAEVSVKGGRLDLAKRELLIDQFTASGSKVLIRRVANGRVEFVQPPQLKVVVASQQDTARPWKVTVLKYRGEDLGLRFEDATVSPTATQTIEGLNVSAENVSTEPGKAATLAARFKLNRKGEVEVGGTARAFPLAVDLKISAKALELLPLQPYFTELLNIELTRGQVTLSGDLQLHRAGNAAGEAVPLSGGFSGQVTVGDLFAIDKINSADFVKWKSLHLGHLDLRLNPNSLAIGEVALADFFARVIVSREGKLNLLQIVRQTATAPAAAPAKASEPAVATAEGKAVAPIATASKPALPIKIGKITLQGGDIRFSDNFIRPNYSANLKQVGGSISGLSSATDSVASLALRGSYDNIAPLTVTAKLNPLALAPYLDLEADVKGIEMTSLSPYSGKYAGYAIEKGKLSLFVKYKIENGQLTAENRLFLDQLTFGDQIASPEATKLPVTLAVALLKNRNGEIDINLPISGSLDDPEFSIGGLVVKVIVNLLVKAVTSPFALLGSVFAGGEELSTVDFDFGQAVITPAIQQRLEKLAQALLDRPALKLEIEGRADTESDPEGLKRARLATKVRALKREDLTKNGVESGSTDSVEVGANEYPALLERVYRAEKFPKPRNLVGMVKGLPVEEMEKLILANSSVDDEDLRDLADRRAKAVRDWLLAHELAGERLFMLPVKLDKPESKAGATDRLAGNRVAFSLK